MEHGKDASRRANAERERDDRDGRDEGSSEKRADGELEIAHTRIVRAKGLRRLPPRAVYRAVCQGFQPRPTLAYEHRVARLSNNATSAHNTPLLGVPERVVLRPARDWR